MSRRPTHSPIYRVLFILAGWAVRAVAVVLAVGGAPGWSASTELFAGVDDKWLYLRSPNFELYSRNGERESREVLWNLELLRAVFSERFKFVERARLDVTVYYHRNLEDFRAHAPATFSQGDFSGFYLPGPDRAVISLAPTDNPESARQLVLHEYVHHLFRAAEQEPPAWFNEGMAELLSTIRIERGQLEIGRPLIGRLGVIQETKLIPLETLFAVDHRSPIYRSNNHTGMFYAESWALLHYWYFGDSGLAPEAVARFTRVAGNGRAAASVDLRAYFRECFGMDYAEMQQRLDAYVSSGQYRFSKQPIPKIDEATSYTRRNVPRDELRLRLAELDLRTQQSPAARFALLDAQAKAATGDPRIFEALGAAEIVARDEARAHEYWEQALTVGSINGAIVRELGLIESRGWFQRFDFYFRLPVETATRLRSRLERSIAHEPQQTAAYEMLAWVEAYSAEPVIPNLNLIQRQFSTLRHQQRTLVALAFVRFRSGLKDEATALLGQLDRLEPDDWSNQAAEVIRGQIEGRRLPESAKPNTKSRRVSVPLTPDAATLRALKTPTIELPEKR